MTRDQIDKLPAELRPIAEFYAIAKDNGYRFTAGEMNAALTWGLQVVEERDARDAQLSRIAETVAKLPSITGLQTGCVKDHSLIWMAIRDAQDAYRDTLARHQREAKQHAGRAETAEATIATLTRELGKLNKLAERHMLSHANQCHVAAFKVAEDFVTATVAALSHTPEGCK